MSEQAKNVEVETILTRAAERAGDITEPAMAIFYQRFPKARESFAHHGGELIHNLEGEMVQQALYCLMTWFESTGEVELMLRGSVPHHCETLNVPPEYYQGLLMATADVVQSTIPTENTQELAVWQELCDSLADLINQSSQHIVGATA